MNKTERLYRLHELLKNARYPVSRDKLMEELECSRATLYRLKDELECWGALVESDERGFYLDKSDDFELPGLHLSGEEIRGLLMAGHLLQDIQGESLQKPLQRLMNTIGDLLETGGYRPRSVQVIRALARPVPPEIFNTVFAATQAGQRLKIRYHARSHDSVSDREVSPQRLTNYRNAWYLDAWCHRAEGFRSFALEQIEAAEQLPTKATLFEDAELNTHFGGAYGIFAGQPDKTARLRFSARVKPWVEKERWHSKQAQHEDEDGCLLLEIPYHHDQELLMDILRYGADVVVESPQELRQKHQLALKAALANYTS
jgi:predicted DNA-binding transcriptional regulator YafY